MNNDKSCFIDLLILEQLVSTPSMNEGLYFTQNITYGNECLAKINCKEFRIDSYKGPNLNSDLLIVDQIDGVFVYKSTNKHGYDFIFRNTKYKLVNTDTEVLVMTYKDDYGYRMEIKNGEVIKLQLMKRVGYKDLKPNDVIYGEQRNSS